VARTKNRRINADKPHLWKADIAASVDRFNQWFMEFAPEAFRSTRLQVTEQVKAALVATNDLRTPTPATLKANPGTLPTLRSTASASRSIPPPPRASSSSWPLPFWDWAYQDRPSRLTSYLSQWR
jgi:hypothetical protein